MTRTADPGIVAITAVGPTLDPALHGGKACGLQELLRLGLAVPAAFVVPVAASAEIAAGVEGSVVTRPFADIAAAVDALIEQDPTPSQRFAVRSGAAISLPGAFDTVLDVAQHDVPEAVATVVASTRGLRVATLVQAMGIDEVPPTAVIVQRQIDTTGDDRSGAGVVTSRDPVTGADGLCGSIAWRSPGDAVMAGRVPVDAVTTIGDRCPDVAAQLERDAARIEMTLGSPVELEFAISSGMLWYLQLRAFAAAPPHAPTEHRGDAPAAQGRPASAGTATGELHVDVDDALDAIDEGRSVIIVLETSSPGDVPVMVRAAGVLTVLGSPESHAAVVTRSAGVPAVVAVQGLAIGADGITLGERSVSVGARVTLDGTHGHIWIEDS